MATADRYLLESGAPDGILLEDGTGVLILDPATYNQSVDGAETPSGAFVRTVTKEVAGTLTSAGALFRSLSTSFGGSGTPAGALGKAVAKYLNGSVTPSGADFASRRKVLSGMVQPGVVTHVRDVVAGRTAGAVASPVDYTVSATVDVGDHLILVVAARNQEVTSVTDSQGNTWQRDVDGTGGSVSLYSAVWSCKVATALVANVDYVRVAWPSGTNSVSVSGAEFAGLHPTTWFDTGSIADAASGATSNSGATGATANPKELLIGVAVVDSSVTGDIFTPESLDPAWVNMPIAPFSRQASSIGAGFAYRIVNEVGTYSAKFTWTTSRAWEGLIGAYIPATQSRDVILTALKVVAGTLTSAGSLIRTVAKFVGGTLTSSGSLVRTVSKFFAGTLTSAGALFRAAATHLGGTLRPGPIAFVQEVGSAGSSGFVASPLVITVTATTTVGHHLIMSVNDNGVLSGVTDSQGNTWQKDVDAGTPVFTQAWSCKVATALAPGDTISIAWASGTRSIAATVSEWSGLHPTSWVDQTVAVNGGSGTSSDSGLTASTTRRTELVYGAVGTQASVTSGAYGPETLDPPWVLLAKIPQVGSNPYPGQPVYRIVAEAGQFAAKFTWGTARFYGTFVVTYLPAEPTSLVKAVLQHLAGTLTSAGDLVKTIATSFAGTLTSAGSLARAGVKVEGGTETPSGTAGLTVASHLSGTLTSAGDSVRTASVHLAGALTTAGDLIRAVVRTFDGTLTSAGDLVRSIAVSAGGALTTAGDSVKTAIKVAAGDLTTDGSLGAATATRVLAGTVAPAGSLGFSISRTFVGAVTPSSINVRQPLKNIAAG